MTDPMDRGRFARPVRDGATVRRRRGSGSANVHALLRHFERVGFRLAPRLIGTSEDGEHELLEFIAGDTGFPPLAGPLRSDQALASVGRAIRALHDATAGFEPPVPDQWQTHEVAMPVRVDCIGHRDLAPWNIVFDGASVVGIIDWDFAGPSNRVWDLAYAAHQFVPFHPTENLAAFGWSEEPDRGRRLALLCSAYGNDVHPEEVLDLLTVRLAATAAHIEQRIRLQDPDFESHRVEEHARGWRAAAAFVLRNRDRFTP